jgi:hypothetical protein
MPFYVAAAVFVILFVIALPRLSSRQIESARREVDAAGSQEG